MNEVTPIQSAYLNLRTAKTDCESAASKWEEDDMEDAVMWIGNAIEQLESARAKILRHLGSQKP